MRFLADHELPDWERKRRACVQEAIASYQAQIDRAWEHAEPILVEYIQKGDYLAERMYRSDIYRRTEVMRREIAGLIEQLPPWLECRKDGILERVPRR